MDKNQDDFMASVCPTSKDWKLVEFRGMIQDILGSEVYSKHNPGEFGDRTIFYCITVPGENDWVRSCHGGDKNEFMTNGSPNSSVAGSQGSSSKESEDNKNDRLSFSLVNWSYPIPSDGKNKSCLLKIYDMNLVEFLRVNNIVQVTGLVEPAEYEDDSQLLTNKSSPKNPSDVDKNGEGTNGNEALSGLVDDDEDEDEFQPASHFPHRLVPRVHVRTLRKLTHTNPLLPEMITRDILDISSIRMARARLSTILTQLLGGDSLAAEYLTLSLISRIQHRKDVTTLGQFSLELRGFKPEMKFLVEKLYEIITRIATHSHMIDMSIANLNNLRFTPKKDYDNNKMIAGTLQLPDGLFLVLDETKLTEGHLTKQGKSNIDTLNHIIRWQRHNYDFEFSNVEIDTDLKVLVISEGKSILTVPYCVPLEKNDPETISSMKTACDSVDDFLTEDLLRMFRYFITALRDVPEYKIPDKVQELIQSDYVSWRERGHAKNEALFSADELSNYMTLARYLTVSKGETTLTEELWRETCEMESARTSRIALKR